MAIRQVIELAHAVVEVEVRNGYLLVVESGQLRSVRDVAAYTSAMQGIITKSGIDRALIDARAEVGDPEPEVRDAMWQWLAAADRGFTMVAFVLPSEMAVARVNMTALSRRAPVRAFDSMQQATRWLSRGVRSGSTLSMPAASMGAGSTAEPATEERRRSSAPPARSDTPAAHAPTEPPPRVSDTASRLPAPPAVPRDARRPSDRGFRPPTPGPSEETVRTSRASELRDREPAPAAPRGKRDRSTTPPKGGKVA